MNREYCTSSTPVKAALAALSQSLPDHDQLDAIVSRLARYGIETDIAASAVKPHGARQKAQEFNALVASGKYDFIFDVSGGDLANLTLPFLDYSAYQNSRTIYAGFSDCTAAINALCTKTGREALLFGLWSIDNVEAAAKYAKAFVQRKELCETEREKGPKILGGNIRCFMKLAGTPYFPDLAGSVLFLESSSCSAMQFASFFAQLNQMDALKECKGIILGRFNAIERQSGCMQDSWKQLLLLLRLNDLYDGPVTFCSQIGHIVQTRGIWINADCPLDVQLQNEEDILYL
jgi:muramoyltetrapeptide carboxypeptidase LdcA involved in peptidoglycan recycling